MIYFLRHGETEYNVLGLRTGQTDVPLNQNGINQANLAKEQVKNIKIDVIYCSPLARAKQTAEIVNEVSNVSIVFDDRLKESNGGKTEGTRDCDWSKEELERFEIDPKSFGAETREEFYKRVCECYDDIKALNKNVLIVSHAGVYKSIYRYLHNIKEVHFKLERAKNASIIVLE